MTLLVRALCFALALASCASPKPKLPLSLDPSNPDAPESRTAPSQRPPAEPGGVAYACPMHPEVRSEAKGSCPKCGMQLRPKAAPEEAAPSGHGEHHHPGGGR